MDEDPLDTIIHELLLGRTQGLDGPRLAAFIDGWGSMLSLLDHPEALMPGAPEALLEAVNGIVERIRAVQARVLEDGDP